MSDPGPGSIVAGRYRVLEKVGEGGASEVFLARDERLERAVALKLLRAPLAIDPVARQRFIAEARAAAGLSHPNVVAVFDFGSMPTGRPFIVMEFVEGPTLAQLLAERRRLPQGEAVRIASQVSLALDAAHERGLIHRDVKPGNVLLDRHGRARLADFGIAKVLTADPTLTQPGLAFGTVAYLSPEQATGGPVGPATDVYALGVVLYEMLAGQPPFIGDEEAARTAYRQAWEEPAPVRMHAPHVDPAIDAVVLRALRKRPEERFSSALAFHDALAEAYERASRPPPPSVHAAAAAAAAAAAPTVVSGAPGYQSYQGPQPPYGAAQQPQGAVAPYQAGPPAYGAPLPIPMAAGAPGAPAAAQPVERGVVFARPGGDGGDRRRGRGAASSILTWLLLLAVIAGLALLVGFVVTRRAPVVPTPSGDAVGAVDPAATASPTLAPITPSPLIVPSPVPPTAAPTPTPEPPTVPPTPPPTPTPTPPPTPPPTAPPTPRPTRRPTAPPTPTPQPQPVARVVELPDGRWGGGYHGTYHGRSAVWVYGQGTDLDTMTASFRLAGTPVGTATLVLVGLDDEGQIKQPIEIRLNGTTLYRGPDPLPNDFCCGSSGPGNWGAVSLRLPADLLRQGQNRLTIENLSASDCTFCPAFVMLDGAELRVRLARG